MSDQRGAPLAIVVTGANTHDKTVALETLDGIAVPRPEKIVYRLHHLCLDRDYDYDDVIEGVLERDYHLHLPPPKDEEPVEIPAEKKHPARRWVVERTHSWHNRCRRLLVHWERREFQAYPPKGVSSGRDDVESLPVLLGGYHDKVSRAVGKIVILVPHRRDGVKRNRISF